MADYITLYKYNVAKLSEAIIVRDGKTNDTDTSLTFIGKGAPSFGISVNQDFLYLLENFANISPPLHPTEGQLWYDSSNDTLTGKKLKVFDSTVWKPINGVWQQDSPPETPERGDIWVNTANAQLYIRTLSGWTLVGPTYSNVLKTGSYADEIKDNLGGTHRVIKNYIDDNVVEIIASDTFYPQPPISGFADGLHPGVNLSSTYNGKLNATATTADALNLADGTTITGDSLVKTTGDSTINARLYIKELAVGKASSNGTTTPWIMNMADNGYQANLQNPIPGGKFVFQTTTLESNGSLPVNVLTIDGASSGVGINLKSTENPKAELDVNGSVKVANSLTITSSTVALNVTKGISYFKNIVSSGSSTFSTSTFVNTMYIGTQDWPISTPGILPVGTGNNAPNIGSETNPFGIVYSKVFAGPPIVPGSVTGTDSSGRLTISNAGGLSSGDPIILSHTSVTGIVTQTTPPAVNTISLSSKVGLSVGMPIKFTFSSSSTTLIQTFASTDAGRPNYVQLGDTTGFAIGMSIVPSNSIGGLVGGQTYYIQSIQTGNCVTVSATPGSSSLTLTAGSGSYTAAIGSVLGGLVSGTTYYIKSIDPALPKITISASYNGTTLALGSSINIPGPNGVTYNAGGPNALGLGSNVIYYILRVYDINTITISDSQANVQLNTPVSLNAGRSVTGVTYQGGTKLENTFVGNLTGGATRLTNSSTWSITGQVSAAGFVYAGEAGLKTFTASLTNSAVASQTAATTVADNDTFLMSQTATGALRKTTKNDLLKDLAEYKVPTGAVMPYAGPVDNTPQGWLLCDGSLVDAGYFPNLFNAIKYVYGKGSVTSQFRLPDLRSRVIMGYDNMTNAETVNGQAALVPAAPSNSGASRTSNVHAEYAQSYALGSTGPITGQINASGSTGFAYSTSTNAASNTALHFHALNYIIKT